ncbi:unnamed protein product [Prorocentrum cordatum]|uniref:PDZ domain-containing protein n=1 Tax=Prorocentrum cordatum TaxID=2364126 RepID=A0ABN9WRY2_9DINO|nr:unnamed protein product [Polarella glacialis]
MGMGNSVGCCSDRDKDEELKASIGRKLGSTKESFRVTLTKASPDDKFGIAYHADKKAIRIIGIAEGSLMDKWNMDNPGREVRVDDRVVEVNGTRAKSQKLVELLETEHAADLLVTRQVIAPDALDGYWRSSNNDDPVFIRKSKAKFENGKTWTLHLRGDGGITAMRSSGEQYSASLLHGGLHWDDGDVWVRDYQEYRIDNSVLKINSKGMAYRTRKDLDARAPEEEAGFAKWGDTITAHDLEDGWVCVHIDYDTYYLPTHVKGIQVLVPQPPTLRASASDALGKRAALEEPDDAPEQDLPAASSTAASSTAQ